MRNSVLKENTSTYHILPCLDGLELLHAEGHTSDFPFHKHDTFNITLILKNTFTTQLVSKKLAAPTGSIAITHPFEIHATPCEDQFGVSFFTFYISPDAMIHLNDGKPIYFADKTINDPQLFRQLFALTQESFKGNELFEERLKNTLALLIRKYSQELIFTEKTTTLFQDFLADFDLRSTFSLEQTAQQFGLNKYKFLRLFKQETGLTPTNYLLHQRIEKGKTLIKENYDLTEVAIACGFYDSSHFHRNFQKFTGITPSTYKRAFQE